jgi:hypothetical protein
VNLKEAIELLDAVSDFRFGASEKQPTFTIYDNQKEGFVLLLKAALVNEKYRNYLKGIVKLRKLRIRESEGYLIIYGSTGYRGL